MFATLCLYGGLFLFYLGIIIARSYNKLKYVYNKKGIILMFSLTLIGLIFSLIQPSFNLIAIITTIVALMNVMIMVHYLYVE